MTVRFQLNFKSGKPVYLQAVDPPLGLAVALSMLGGLLVAPWLTMAIPGTLQRFR